MSLAAIAQQVERTANRMAEKANPDAIVLHFSGEFYVRRSEQQFPFEDLHEVFNYVGRDANGYPMFVTKKDGLI